MSIRWGVAARRCDLATMPIRDAGVALIGCYPLFTGGGAPPPPRTDANAFGAAAHGRASAWPQALSSYIRMPAAGSVLAQMQKEFLVAGRAGDRRWRHANPIEPRGDSRRGDPSQNGVVHGGVGDEPAFADLVSTGLELRFDERDDIR